MRKGRHEKDFEREFEIEKKKIENVLSKKSPLSAEKIFKGKYNSKYIQTNLYDGSNRERLTLCKEKRVFRLGRNDFLEHKKQKIKIPSKQFMDYYGGWGKQVHSYYFAIPKTYFIKTKIFDEILREIFLESKEISEFIDHKEEIEELLRDAEKFMSWIEITPTIKKGYKKLYKSNNFSQYIIDFICGGKDVSRALYLITDFCLAPTLRKIEDLLLFGNPDDSYINVYRIFRDKLSKKKIIELPEDYKKHIEGKTYEKAFWEEWKRLEEEDLKETP